MRERIKEIIIYAVVVIALTVVIVFLLSVGNTFAWMELCSEHG